NSPLTLTLASAPVSLRLSGSVSGPGSARVLYVTPQGKKVVYDSALVKGDTFSGTCIDTCVIESAGNDVTLEIELTDAQLTIGTLQYATKSDVNHAPQWTGQVSSVTLARDTPTVLDLQQLFIDTDGDTLGFIAGDAPGVDVSVSGTHVTFTARTSGDHAVSIVASDGKDATTATLTLHVQ
ncbi:MAG: hypothetical protein AABY13_02580, partial [Nanoarchaeota archaeon]